jgi:methylphosphonate synthase
MIESEYLKSIGARIFSEANDLKRTIESMSKDLGVDFKYLQKVIDGDCNKKDTFKIIDLIEKAYPIDSSNLRLINDDSQNGVLYFSAKNSKKTSRVFNRIDKNKKQTPYYEYRDTAMSKLAPFKPEWIKELRHVSNSDPNNADVVYNRGHFLHQFTFYVGPVNFYYIVNGKKYCHEMNTGDSNYGTPFIPHTFANRDKTREAYIVAITFGGNVSRAQKELYALGNDTVQQYILDIRDDNKAVSQLIQQHMDNENLTRDMVSKKFNIGKLLDVDSPKTIEEIEKISNLFNISPSDLMLPRYNKNHEVLVCKKATTEAIYYPNDKDRTYKVYPGARVNKMPNLKTFNVEILSRKVRKIDLFKTSLHNYVYSYGKADVLMVWIDNNKKYSQLLKTGDSIYIKPFISYGFQNTSTDISKVFIARIEGSINFSTQKELSYFLDIDRSSMETKCWFD